MKPIDRGKELKAFLELDQDRSIRQAYLLGGEQNLSKEGQSALEAGTFDEFTLTLDALPESEPLEDYLVRELKVAETAGHQWLLVNLKVNDKSSNDADLSVKQVLEQLGQRFLNQGSPPMTERLEKILETEIGSIVDRLETTLAGDQVSSELRYGFGWALGRWMAEFYLNKFDNNEATTGEDEIKKSGLDDALDFPELTLKISSTWLEGNNREHRLEMLQAAIEDARVQVARRFGLPLLAVSTLPELEEEEDSCSFFFREVCLWRGRLSEGEWPTQLADRLQKNVWRLLSLQTTGHLLERLAREHPGLMIEFERENIPLSVVRGVLRELLREGYSIKNMATIIEAILEVFPTARHLGETVMATRQALGSFLYRHLLNHEGHLEVLDLSPETEQYLGDGYSQRGLAELATPLILPLLREMPQPTILVSGHLRAPLWDALHPEFADLTVLSYAEIEPGQTLMSLHTVDLPHQPEAPSLFDD